LKYLRAGTTAFNFVPSTGSGIVVSYLMDESGIPRDLLTAGLIIAVGGSALMVCFKLLKDRKSKMARETVLEQQPIKR
jgi:hypothetical protein